MIEQIILWVDCEYRMSINIHATTTAAGIKAELMMMMIVTKCNNVLILTHWYAFLTCA